MDEQAAYTKTARPKYTDKKGQKLVYLSHGWSKEGVAFFKMVEQAWIDKFDNRTWYERFEVGWDEHVSSTGLGQHWKERTQSVTVCLVCAPLMWRRHCQLPLLPFPAIEGTLGAGRGNSAAKKPLQVNMIPSPSCTAVMETNLIF